MVADALHALGALEDAIKEIYGLFVVGYSPK